MRASCEMGFLIQNLLISLEALNRGLLALTGFAKRLKISVPDSNSS
jgi:hypothetical protein